MCASPIRSGWARWTRLEGFANHPDERAAFDWRGHVDSFPGCSNAPRGRNRWRTSGGRFRRPVKAGAVRRAAERPQIHRDARHFRPVEAKRRARKTRSASLSPVRPCRTSRSSRSTCRRSGVLWNERTARRTAASSDGHAIARHPDRGRIGRNPAQHHRRTRARACPATSAWTRTSPSRTSRPAARNSGGHYRPVRPSRHRRDGRPRGNLTTLG